MSFFKVCHILKGLGEREVRETERELSYFRELQATRGVLGEKLAECGVHFIRASHITF